MLVRVLFFGPARDAAQHERVELMLPDNASVEDALTVLVEQFPSLRLTLPRCRIAVNTDYANATTLLRDGDELAIIPPVSGGMEHRARSTEHGVKEKVLVSITDRPINLTQLLEFVTAPNAGAVMIFLGTVRNNSKGKPVTALTYEAYVPMAEKELHRIADEMQQRWQACKVAIVHRVGTLQIGEASVAIVVSAPHRADAFAAARHAIERIKEIVPIWKREHFADGMVEWA